MQKRLQELWYDEEGVAAVEYAVLIGALAVGAASAWQMLGEAITDVVTDAANTISSGGVTPSG